eukprot:Nitzschia sp. Nitz4//scaffold77_size91520//38466//40181//NITZ4_004888-RA/size91520-processed-gene-0.31-mRNA-1//1//CDS//3329557985//6176//frame0
MKGETTWKLCLASSKGRKILNIPASATTEELYQRAQEELQSPDAPSMKFGFPPKPIPRDSTTILSGILQNQERIQVEWNAASSRSNTTSISSPKPSTSSPEPTRRASKRAASKRAAEAMPAVIQQQEKMMKEQKKPASKRPRNTVSTSKPPTKRAPPAVKFSASLGEGQRLSDGVKVAPPPSRGRGAKRATNPLGPSQNQTSDMSEALLGALNDSGKMGRVLRKGMKNAVRASYETTRTFSRLAAIQSQHFTMELSGNTLKISYSGSVDKAKTEEDVDYIPRDVLEEVIKGIHASNEEALRPENLALLSPRVLWSLVYHFGELSNVADMYKSILPDLDWSFLRRRAQQLSEKAQENLRQQQQEENGDVDDTKAMEAVAAVEHSMEHLHDHTAAERKSLLAQAALRRLQAGNGTRTWKLITPSEPDRDELRECIAESPIMANLITQLMKECQVHNWRELANVEDTAALAKQLNQTEEIVQNWISRAQEQSVEEIILEICDGNVAAVRLLMSKARSGTPKDLAGWRSIPQFLHQQLGGDPNCPTLEQLQVWTRRAHESLKEFQWLNWFATPVG